MKKFSFCLAAAALCALLLAACSSAAPSSSAGSAALSGAPTGDISAPAGQAEPEPAPSSTASVASSFASAPAATEYGSGTWVVEATKEGDIPSLERLEFQDGELVYHYFSSSEIGKAVMAGTARTSWNIPPTTENRRRGHGPAGRGRVYGDHPAGIMKAARPPECSDIKQEQKQGPKLNCPCFFNVFLPLRPGVLLCLRRKCGFARFRQR